jgi:hypothetical protein
MSVKIISILYIVVAILLAGCSASVGPAPTPVPLPTLAPLAAATPDTAALLAQTEQHRIDADLERLRIEATATANAMNLSAQQQIVNATVTANAMNLSAQQADIAATAQARGDARAYERQIAAQHGQQVTAQALALRDMQIAMALTFVALGLVACATIYIWQRGRVDLAQIHTGRFLPMPTTVVGNGKIVRVYGARSPVPLPDRTLMLTDAERRALVAAYLATLSIDDLETKTAVEYYQSAGTSCWSVEGTDTETGQRIGAIVQAGGRVSAYLLTG